MMDSKNQSGDSSATPLCSLIIPTKDKLEYLKPCIESVLASANSADIEILVVDNQSVEPETQDYLASLGTETNIRVLQWSEEFNFSAINNFAAQQCCSEYICFLNNDIEIADPEWLNKLLTVASIAEVGAVGCTLLYPNKHIQHAGIALDQKTIAQHIALGEDSDFLRNNGIARPYAVDAVTAACMLMRKSLFLRLGGFNEQHLAVAFNDVDLCLRLADKGFPVLCHPGVALVHHESISRQSDELPSNRKRALKEHAFMQFRWRLKLLGHSFTHGIPEHVLNDALEREESDADIFTTVRLAADNLYLQENAPGSGAKSLNGLYANSPAFSETQDFFQNLQDDYKHLEAHAQRLERAHALIENSIFWRMTLPLRWLKSLVLPGGNSQAEAANGDQPADEQSIGSSSQGDRQSLAKERTDRSARSALKNFLDSDSSIQLPVSDSPRLSIILVFYQQAHLSLLCLQSLLEHGDVDYEIVIVDNGSTDDTSRLLDRINNASILRNTENLGFVKAVNQAAEVARGDYLLLLNNDALIEKQTLSNALAVIENDETVGAVGAKIKLLDGSLQEAGSIIWNDGACLGYGRGQRPDSYQFAFQRDVDYCSGAFLLFRRSDFEELMGFDVDYAPAYYEESDFCIRLQQKGLRIIYTPKAEITHYEFASSGGLKGASKLQAAHREILCNKHSQFLSGKLENNRANVLAGRSSNSLPNVLIIDDRVPYPSLGAGYPRCANLLQEISKLDLNISFYPLLFTEEEWSDVYSIVPDTIEVILNSGQDGLQDFLESRKNHYQYIFVSRVHNMQFLNFCLNKDSDLLGDAKIIYDAEAVTAPREILRQELFGQPMNEAERRDLFDEELEQSSLATKITAVSQNEANIFTEHGYSDTVVLGHTIASNPGSKEFAKREGLLFVGALRDDGSPNVDSLLWFIINVLPLLEERLPGITLNVVGDNTAPSLATIAKDNIRFLGRLDSIEDTYNNCRVFIAPTRFAAGIPHKIHEAAAKGLPSVTTALLAQQLGWNEGEQLLLADEAQQFAQQCHRLYTDETLWNRIRDRGLAAVEDDCSQDRFRQNLASLFD